MSDNDTEQKPQTDNEIPRAFPPITPPFDIEVEKRADEQEAQNRFLQAWAEFDSIGKACKFAMVSRAQVERWKLNDPEFAERMDDIHQAAVDDVESVLPMIAKDSEAADSARIRAAEIYLRGNRPEKYNPHREAESRPVQINLIFGKRPKLDSKTIDVKAIESKAEDD